MVPIKVIHGADCEGCTLNPPSRKLVPTFVPDDWDGTLIIGEAPGLDEARAGRPFVGMSGKLLRDIAQEVGYDISKAAFTNAVLCRPPNNREPLQSELDACHGRLMYDIMRLNPKRIVALGTTAAKTLGYKKIKGNRGAWIETAIEVDSQLTLRIPTLLSWHPAYALRSPVAVPDLQHDLSLLVRTQDEVGEYNIHLVDELPDGPGDVLNFDIETVHRAWDEDSRILWAGFSYVEDPTEIYIIKNPSMQTLRQALSDKSVRVWNASMEWTWLYLHADLELDVDADGMIYDYLVDERPNRHGLKQVARELLGVEDWALTKAQYVAMDTVPDEIVIPYLAKDIFYMHHCIERLIPRMTAEGQWRVWNTVLRPAIPTMCRASAWGIEVDPSVWNALAAERKVLLAEAANALSQEAYPLTFQKPKRKRNKETGLMEEVTNQPYPINYNSPDQIGTLLYEHFAMEVPRFKARSKKKTTKPPTGEKVIEALLKDYPHRERALRAINTCRAEHKMIHTYLEGFQDHFDANRRLHPQFNLHTVSTGRLSISNPGLHQVPKALDMRSGFVADEGWVFLEADYSQIEVRVLAEVAGATRLKEWFAQGLDVYREFAKHFYRTDDPTKEQRNSTKPIILGIIYVRQPESIAEQLYIEGVTPTIDVLDATHKYNMVMALAPEINAYFKRQAEVLYDQQYVTSMLGRRRRFPLITDGNQAELVRQAINSPIQGGASDFNIVAGTDTDNRYRLLDLRALPVLYIHDANLVMAHKDDALDAAAIMVDSMKNAPALLGLDDWSTPLDVEILMGPRWGKKNMVELDVHELLKREVLTHV